MSGYYLNKNSGTFTVNGSDTNIDLVFRQYNYISGLLFPANSTLYINGKPVPVSSNHEFNISEKSGIYEIEVTDSGYAPYYRNVTLQNGTYILLNISLKEISNDTNNQTGLNGNSKLIDYASMGGVLIAIVGLVAFVTIRRRRN